MNASILKDSNGKLRLYEALEKSMWDSEDPALVPTRRPSGLSPSSGSAVVVDPVSGITTVIGKCLRSAWYRYMGFEPEKRLPDPRNWRIRQMGDLISDGLITDALKRSNLYQADELSFYDPDNFLSGRVDHIGLIPGTNIRIGIETKSIGPYSCYPYVKTGRGFKRLEPRFSDLPQVMSYMQWFSQFGIRYWALYYVTRDMETNMFCFEWVNFGEGDRPQDSAYLRCHSSEGSWDLDWLTWGQVKVRYHALREALENKVIPARDFRLQWDNPHIVSVMKVVGKGSQLAYMSKTDSDAVVRSITKQSKKTKDTSQHDPYIKKGDFGCAFCDYQSRCWSGLDVPSTMLTGKDLQKVKTETTTKIEKFKPDRIM